MYIYIYIYMYIYIYIYIYIYNIKYCFSIVLIPAWWINALYNHIINVLININVYYIN